MRFLFPALKRSILALSLTLKINCMKKSTLMLAVLLFAASQTILAANINITISGFAYSPAAVDAAIGDVVMIAASGTHPLVQVDQTNWNANSPTPVGGWTNQTTAYTFTVTTSGTFYYGCANHMGIGMKGYVTMSPSGIQQVIASSYHINLFPNPITNAEFTVKAEGYTGGEGKVLVYNEVGRLVESHNLDGSTTLVKTQLPSGLYFYTVMLGTQPVYRSKFIVTQNK
jgi:plastocyanin